MTRKGRNPRGCSQNKLDAAGGVGEAGKKERENPVLAVKIDRHCDCWLQSDIHHGEYIYWELKIPANRVWRGNRTPKYQQQKKGNLRFKWTSKLAAYIMRLVSTWRLEIEDVVEKTRD